MRVESLPTSLFKERWFFSIFLRVSDIFIITSPLRSSAAHLLEGEGKNMENLLRQTRFKQLHRLTTMTDFILFFFAHFCTGNPQFR